MYYATQMTKLFKTTYALLLLPMLWLSADAQAEPWQEEAFLVQAFNEVALQNEYEAMAKPVRKWNKPVKVWLTHKVAEADKHTQLVQMHLSHLSQITGHSISLADDNKSANVHVVFTQQSSWAQDVAQLLGAGATSKIKNAVCMASFKLNARGEIDQAWVVIPVDQAEMHRKLVSCIVEELTQVMGLPNDSEKVYPSIFNDKTPEDLLTGLDSLLLKMLYHPHLKIGMTAEQVRPVLHQIIADWQQNNTILNAEKNVRQGGLYQLLGY